MYINGEGGQGDAFSFMILPTYEVVDDRLQLALRYSYSHAEDNILRLQQRYEQEVAPAPLTDGHDYHSIYAGLNWFLHGHKLKVMTGVEYSTMQNNRPAGVFDG